MADEKINESAVNVEPSAPLFGSGAQTTDEMSPPPPYYDPLPPVITQQAQSQNGGNSMINPPIYSNVQPSAIYLSPADYQSKLGSSPTRLRCPNCSAEIVTLTRFTSGCMTWAICGSICAIGYVSESFSSKASKWIYFQLIVTNYNWYRLFVPCAWLGCQLLPFCVESCKDVRHTCPNCRHYIGTFDRLK